MKTDEFASRLTPIDKSYATCERTVAKLCIYPEVETWEQVTAILGLEPTRADNKGEISSGTRGRALATHTLWLLSSEYQVDSLDLREHLAWLLDKLVPRKEELRYLQGCKGLRMSMSCVWWSRFGHGGPAVWPEQLRLMAELNLEFSIDFSYFGDED